MVAKDDTGAPPLTQKLMAVSAQYGGAPGQSSAGGGSAAEIFAQAMAESGMDPSNPAAVSAATGADPSNPLTWAAMSISQRTTMLPAWARDLRILGLGAMEAPEPFVFMRDIKRQVAAPASVDTPQGFGSDAPHGGGDQ